MRTKKNKIIYIMIIGIITTILTGCEDKDIKGLKLVNCTRKTEEIDNAKSS